MNKIILLLFGIMFFASTNKVSCQEIVNVEWLACNIYNDSTYLKFENDTLFYRTVDNGIEEEFRVSTYVIEADTITLNDLEIINNCDPLITGKYIYQVEQDTLSFDEIIDNCEARRMVLSELKLKRGLTSRLAKVIDDKIKIFPNPVIDRLIIEGEGAITYSYVVYNQVGNQVASGIITGKGKIDLEKLEFGFYILRLVETSQCLREDS